jgi:phosphoserine phosphatase RsbU/P
LMTSLQARVQVLLEERIEMAALVTRLNSSITTSCPGNRFITFFICEIDPATGEVTYCNAGHNPPFLVGSTGKVTRLDDGGPVLGVLPKYPFTQHTCRMEEGDVLMMYTDGVTEAERTGTDEEFGEDKLLKLVQGNHACPVAQMVELLTQEVAAFAGSVTAADDFTAVVVRRTACKGASAATA